MPRKKRVSRKGRKFPQRLLALFFILAVLILFAMAAIAYFRNDMKKEERFLPYEGSYRFEEVDGPIGSKVGDLATIRYRDGCLVATVGDNPREIFLYPESGDDFNVKQFNYHVTFLREAGGKVVGLASKTDKKIFYFMLQRVDR